MEPDEKQLVLKAQGGDRLAYDELMLLYQGYVLKVAWKALENEADAEEVRQNTFLRAWRFIDKFQSKSKFSTWLHTIVTNECWTLRRKNPPFRSIPLNEALCSDSAKLFSENPQQGATKREGRPEFGSSFLAESNCRFKNMELIEIAREALKELEDREAVAVYAHFFLGHQLGEVASALGLTIGEVKSMVKKFGRHAKRIAGERQRSNRFPQPVERSP